MTAALKIIRSVMTTEIVRTQTTISAILLKPLKFYWLACKLAEIKNEVFLLFEETMATSAAENTNMELKNVEGPVTAEIIEKVKDVVTASLRNDIAVKER